MGLWISKTEAEAAFDRKGASSDVATSLGAQLTQIQAEEKSALDNVNASLEDLKQQILDINRYTKSVDLVNVAKDLDTIRDTVNNLPKNYVQYSAFTSDRSATATALADLGTKIQNLQSNINRTAQSNAVPADTLSKMQSSIDSLNANLNIYATKTELANYALKTDVDKAIQSYTGAALKSTDLPKYLQNYVTKDSLASTCRTMVTPLGDNNPSNHPLKCHGNEYMRSASMIKSGTQYQYTYKCCNVPGTTKTVGPWSCVSDVFTPVRRNEAGDIECMSTNGKDCAWKANAKECLLQANTGVSPLNPMACTVANYNTPTHWCAKTYGLIADQ